MTVRDTTKRGGVSVEVSAGQRRCLQMGLLGEIQGSNSFLGCRQSEENPHGGIKEPGIRNSRKAPLTLRTEGAGRGNGFLGGFEDWMWIEAPGRSWDFQGPQTLRTRVQRQERSKGRPVSKFSPPVSLPEHPNGQRQLVAK